MWKQKHKTKKEKAQLYGCDGQCYWNTGMCPCVETCPETRTKEGLATIAAIISYIVMLLLVPIMMAVLIVGFWVATYAVANFLMGLLGLL